VLTRGSSPIPLGVLVILGGSILHSSEFLGGEFSGVVDSGPGYPSIHDLMPRSRSFSGSLLITNIAI